MALADREAFPCCRDHWVVPVGDENLETCISPASAGPLFALGLMSQFEFWRCPWKIAAGADHVGGRFSLRGPRGIATFPG